MAVRYNKIGKKCQRCEGKNKDGSQCRKKVACHAHCTAYCSIHRDKKNTICRTGTKFTYKKK